MGGIGGGSVPPAPKPKPPALMPDPESPEVKEAKRLALLNALKHQGRESTILTQPSARPSGAGYDSFNRTTLGGQ